MLFRSKDEINAGLDAEDKLMADAYATRVIGGLYSDYIAPLGTYYFVQDPQATQIAADKDKIALSNQERGEASALNSIYAIWAGLLRNVKEWTITIVEDSTGEVIFTQSGYNQRISTTIWKNNGIISATTFIINTANAICPKTFLSLINSGTNHSSPNGRSSSVSL